jgi:hypothetical protein
MSGRAKKAHPGLGACQSEKLELELARSLCASGSITDMVRLIIHKSREKSYHCRRMGDYAATREAARAALANRVDYAMSALRPLTLQERRQSGHGTTSHSCH